MHFWNLSNNFMLSWMYAYVTEKNLRVQHHLIRDITLTEKLNKIVKSNSNEFEYTLQIVLHLVHFSV